MTQETNLEKHKAKEVIHFFPNFKTFRHHKVVTVWVKFFNFARKVKEERKHVNFGAEIS